MQATKITISVPTSLRQWYVPDSIFLRAFYNLWHFIGFCKTHKHESSNKICLDSHRCSCVVQRWKQQMRMGVCWDLQLESVQDWTYRDLETVQGRDELRVSLASGWRQQGYRIHLQTNKENNLEAKTKLLDL